MAAYRAALIYMLKKLFITDFRNINSAEIDLKPGLTLISGDNGQGKTNFLEALFMVSQGWSFRSRSHDDVINWDAKECMLRVQGEIAVISESEFEQGFLLRRRRGAEVRVDSQKSTNMGELHGRYGCVYMGPEDIALVRGAPELRRRWVDVLMSKSHPDGLDLLRKFRRILRQRNSWLKTSDQNFYGDEQWFALTDIFVQLWSQISQRRAQVLEDCIPLLNEFYAEISGGAEDINLSYINGTGLELAELVSIDLQELQQILLEKMEKLKAREQIMGLTMAGAHREDFALNFSHGKDFRYNGSQGQCRSAGLALGLTAFEYTQRYFQQNTALLVDDIFAELDAKRRQSLANLITKNVKQVFAALPRTEDLPFSSDHLLQVQKGEITTL